METIEINKANAIKAYQKANSSEKVLLENLFTKEALSEKITDRVKTFEDALEIVGCSENAKILLDYNGQDTDMIAAREFMKLTIIAKALNEGWKPNWKDSSEYKYYVWMKASGSGVGFSFNYYAATGTAVGSRLCYATRELAEYAGKQFESIYNDYFTL